MTTFSYCAECDHDISNFESECLKAGIQISQKTELPYGKVEFQADATLSVMQDIARKVPDGHVLLRTLKDCPLKDNSFDGEDIV